NLKADTALKKTILPTAFAFNANASHYVMIILNKVDIVFGNETKNAFARYNSEKFYNKTYDVSLVDLNPDNKLVLIKPFANAQEATDYALQAKHLAAGDIIP